jgi:hypothetical protein
MTSQGFNVSVTGGIRFCGIYNRHRWFVDISISMIMIFSVMIGKGLHFLTINNNNFYLNLVMEIPII